MRKIQTANQLIGRSIGALFFAIFGAIWLVLAFYALGGLHAAAVAGIAAGLAALVLAALWLFSAAKRWQRVADDPAIRRAFRRVNAAQWIACFIAALALRWLHRDLFIVNAITAIVGLHMFPLARIFRYAPHYATGAVLLGWAAASAVFVPAGELQGVDALGTGVILWLSAAVTLVLALQAARQPAELPAHPGADAPNPAR